MPPLLDRASETADADDVPPAAVAPFGRGNVRRAMRSECVCYFLYTIGFVLVTGDLFAYPAILH